MAASVIVLILRIIFLILLFTFLGWTIYTIWKDLRFKSLSVQLQKVPAITLIDRSGGIENNKVSYENSEVSIGRDPGNTICIEDTTVSNRHAVLNYRNGHWWIEDLLSTNGTFLNDEKITAPTILITGDDLHIGNQFYEIRLS